TMAARVSGNVHSAFPAGPPAGVTLPAGQSALKESARPLSLVVFADTDLLSDYLWVREQSFFGQRIAQAWASNGDLVQNALDNLAGSTDLISVRGRASFTRPFERVEKLRRAADDRFRAKEQELEQQLRETEDKLTALRVAGLALVGFAMWVASQRHLERATLAGDLVLPDLEHHVNAVTEVALRKADGTHATLKRNGAGWSVGERGWPADPDKVRKLL